MTHPDINDTHLTGDQFEAAGLALSRRSFLAASTAAGGGLLLDLSFPAAASAAAGHTAAAADQTSVLNAR